MRLSNEQIEQIAEIFATDAVKNLTDDMQRGHMRAIIKATYISGFISAERIINNKAEYGFKVALNSGTLYFGERTSQGFVFKDTSLAESDHDAICYIAEGAFEDKEYIIIKDEDKEQMIGKGWVSTFNSTIEEVEQAAADTPAESDKVFHAYMAMQAIDVVDWQGTQSYIYETDIEGEYEEYMKSYPALATL